MRKTITLAVLLLFSLSIFAQEVENALEQIVISDSNSFVSPKNSLPVRKLKTGMDVNMGYMFSSAGYGGPVFSLTPKVIYPLSERFWLEAGVQAGYGQFMVQENTENGTQFKMLPMTQLFIYASGNYKVNEKLVVTGSAYRQVLNNSNSNQQAVISNYINNGISVGFNYKLGSNVSFGAQIHINSRDNFNPYPGGIYNPYAGYSNPYGW